MKPRLKLWPSTEKSLKFSQKACYTVIRRSRDFFSNLKTKTNGCGSYFERVMLAGGLGGGGGGGG